MNSNVSFRPRCFRCKQQKPAGENNYITDGALEAVQNNKAITWQEVVDPSTYQMYAYAHLFYNTSFYNYFKSFNL
jgi:hypothetical protein